MGVRIWAEEEKWGTDVKEGRHSWMWEQTLLGLQEPASHPSLAQEKG